jgi:hypothetical protein
LRLESSQKLPEIGKPRKNFPRLARGLSFSPLLMEDHTSKAKIIHQQDTDTAPPKQEQLVEFSHPRLWGIRQEIAEEIDGVLQQQAAPDSVGTRLQRIMQDRLSSMRDGGGRAGRVWAANALFVGVAQDTGRILQAMPGPLRETVLSLDQAEHLARMAKILLKDTHFVDRKRLSDAEIRDAALALAGLVRGMQEEQETAAR